jgi:serine/threonine-protein kinase RsbW
MSAELTPVDKENDGQSVRLLDLEIPGEAGAVAAATDTISDTLLQLDCPEEKRLEIALAVQEALANAVVHGCKNDPSKLVHCRMEHYPSGRILVVVTDPGPGFLPDGISNPTSAENLHRSHGRGVYLILELMDDVRFAGNGNELQMWKY